MTLESLLHGKRLLLLDFDGPVCSIFAHFKAKDVAELLKEELRSLDIPLTPTIKETDDPLEVFRESRDPKIRHSNLINKSLTRFEMEAAETASPTPHADEVIQAAHSAGITVAIASNNSALAIKYYLERQGLAHLVARVIGRSANPDLLKPHPFSVNAALKALSSSPDEAVFIGDSTSDVFAGQAAKVPVIGYANKPGKAEKLGTAGSAVIITTMQELIPPMTASRVSRV